ncbi:O-antigen ligase family protein [bacterium]|nr:O-antigen ligase family protein [bacterium]
MGKKSRLKKERRETRLRQGYGGQRSEIEESKRETPLISFLLDFIRFGTYLALFTPLILNSKFYFPFVGPKSLYFMGVCQIVFFVWLFLAINYKKYRPKLNAIFLALILFLIVLILSSVFGVDFSRSFWSKYERMTGLLMWLHLFGFFLVLSSTFKKVSDWQKIFAVSISVAMLVGAGALFEKAGIKEFIFSDRGGFTLGNTSFLGTYLLFNAFLALWLFFQKRNWGWRIYSLTGVGLMALAMYLQGARAATGSFFGGVGLIFLLWLAFQPNSSKLRIFGKILLTISIGAVVLATVLLFVPGSFVHQKFGELSTEARFVNWEMAQKGFLEKPLLGWGPENYTLTFTKFFNPCLFTPRCGGEIWFDRTHNIVFDTLVTTGIFGLLTYLGLFFSLFYVLWRKFLKEKSLDFWTFSIFTAIPVAYFIQNLTVFDMATSLIMFFLILGFGAFLSNLGREKEIARTFNLKHSWVGVILFFIFLFTFFEFIIQPFRTDALVIKSLRAQNSQQRIELYQKTLETSSMGKYQIREFFAQQSQSIIQQNLQKIPKEDIKKELDFLISELEKTEKESPLDFRSILRMAQLYNVYVLIDTQKLPLAQKYGERAIELSPTNQQGYWVLAQTKLYQGDFETAMSLAQKAIDLEPKWFQSHQIAVQIAQVTGNQQLARELAQKAIAINSDWQEKFKEVLGENSLDRED